MDLHVEKAATVAHVTVQLVTLNWRGVADRAPYSGYRLSQRLSDDHSPLRIGNVRTPEVLPRVRSVGLLPPGHGIRMFPVEKPLRVIYCTFDEGHFEATTGMARDYWDRHIGALVAMRNQRLEVLMQEIHAELEQPGFGHEIVIESATNLILVELARYGRHLDRRSARQSESLALAPWQLRRIEERIRASLELGYPNLQELAELCGISQGHLARSYKAATGWQIHKHIAEERLKAAKAMLTADEHSCEEIALRLGFKSPTYFSTVFRRMTGKTPTEFRRQARPQPAAAPPAPAARQS